MNFDQLIAEFRRMNPEVRDTGLQDSRGTPIKTGDIIKFYTRAETAEAVPFDSPGPKHEVIDVVLEIDRVVYFISPSTHSGARAWRYNQVCQVVGNLQDNPELLRGGELSQMLAAALSLGEV
jgi:hypothetical protein